VDQRDWRDVCAEELDGTADGIDFDERDSADFGLAIKDVGKGAAKHIERFGVRENGKRRFLADVEGANVVKAKNVIGVSVGEKYRVQTLETDAQSLLAKIGRGVDNNMVAVAGEKDRRAEPVVARVLRSADPAMATERGNAHGCAGTKEREF